MKGTHYLEKASYKATKFVKRNLPTILTCAGAAGVVATSVYSVKGATKASKLLEEAKKEKGEDLTTLETIRVAGPSYIPAILFGAATIGCMFGANVLNKRNQASLMSAYALLDNSYKEYKSKLTELYGQEAHDKIVEAIAVEKTTDTMYIYSTGICSTCTLALEDESTEKHLFYDEYSERYFEATLERVMAAEYHLNRNYILRGSACVNEFYEFLGLEPLNYGDDVGWDIYDEIYWIDFNHHKFESDDGLEGYIIEMLFGPVPDFRD